jgi:hypothetical protein
MYCTWNLEFLYESILKGFEVLTVILMKIQVFWDVKACRMLKNYQHFWRIVPPPRGSGSPERHGSLMSVKRIEM